MQNESDPKKLEEDKKKREENVLATKKAREEKGDEKERLLEEQRAKEKKLKEEAMQKNFEEAIKKTEQWCMSLISWNCNTNIVNEWMESFLQEIFILSFRKVRTSFGELPILTSSSVMLFWWNFSIVLLISPM